jgi:hypothetical protein
LLVCAACTSVSRESISASSAISVQSSNAKVQNKVSHPNKELASNILKQASCR